MKVETLTDCRIYVGDVLDSLRAMPADSVHCCVTSPPYWALRDYGVEGQIGLEPTIGEYVAKMVEVFREVRRVLHPSGVCWVNLGDTYAGSGRGGNPIGSPHQKQSTNAGSIIGETARVAANTRHAGQNRCGEITAKNLCGIPWRVYLAMQDDGWYWRDSIAWHKPSPMPESVQDRCTKAWEPIGMFAKSAKYFYDAVAIAEDAKYGDRGSSFTNGKTFEHQGRRSVGRGEFNGKTNALTGREAFRAITQTRNRRNVWTIAPEPFTKESTHFATFPSELPRLCIMAGSSEHGCCPACLSPYRRVTDKQKRTRQRPNDYTKRTGADGTGNSCANSVAGVAVTTLGWEPACQCNGGEPIPCTVLDPFMGSGTTGAVAFALHRRFVGCELNPEYVALAKRRIGGVIERTRLLDPIGA